jgi:hypothetical protein
MSYYPHPESTEMNYSEYLSKTNELADIIDQNEKTLKRFFHLVERLRDWDTFFIPKVSITEVNNPNMGHIYLGKIRVPVNFASTKIKDNGKPIPNVLTFVVCKYAEYPGEEFKEKRTEVATIKAMERLKKNYPERFNNDPRSLSDYEEEEGDVLIQLLPEKVKRIKDFLSQAR